LRGVEMKIISIAAALVLASTLPGWAAEMTKGVVKKLDEQQMKVTIKHEELKNLDMSAMTMVFAIGDAAMLEKLKVGSAIEFVADRVNGRITVTEVK
jgi:Cu/Ag efflux protein CusF